MSVITVGSVCSGIEAASVAWEALRFRFDWFSEIAAFPSQVLREKHPHIPNLGDMNDISELLRHRKIPAPDIICGGTPCQAFSLTGLRNGLNDRRGNLTIMNPRLEKVLLEISSLWSAEDIEKRSRIQRRGRISKPEYLQLSFIA